MPGPAPSPAPPAPVRRLRRARAADLDALQALEEATFPPARCESRASLLRSISSPFQETWILPGGAVAAGSMTLRLHRRSVRLYSIAVHAPRRGEGLGEALLARAFATARARRARSVSLEADARDRRLLAWYAARGFQVVSRLPDYYGLRADAVRMRLSPPYPTRRPPQPAP